MYDVACMLGCQAITLLNTPWIVTVAKFDSGNKTGHTCTFSDQTAIQENVTSTGSENTSKIPLSYVIISIDKNY